MRAIRKELEYQLDESGIMQGGIIRIERDYTGGYGGIILTIRLLQPSYPMSSITDPNHPELKPFMDKYRKEMDTYHGFHVGAVLMKMPTIEG